MSEERMQLIRTDEVSEDLLNDATQKAFSNEADITGNNN
jgi:hypothetical protein